MGWFGNKRATTEPKISKVETETFSFSWMRTAEANLMLSPDEIIFTREDMHNAGVEMIRSHPDYPGLAAVIIPAGKQEVSIPISSHEDFRYGNLEPHPMDNDRIGRTKNIFTQLPGGQIMHRSQIELTKEGRIRAQVVRDYDEDSRNITQRLIDSKGRVRMLRTLQYAEDNTLQAFHDIRYREDGSIDTEEHVTYQRDQNGVWVENWQRGDEAHDREMIELVGDPNQSPRRPSIRVSELREG